MWEQLTPCAYGTSARAFFLASQGPGVLALLTVPRNTLLQMMFEIHSPPAVFLAKNAALSAFSMGRQTSLVMDCGYDATTGSLSVCGSEPAGYIMLEMFCGIRLSPLSALP